MMKMKITLQLIVISLGFTMFMNHTVQAQLSGTKVIGSAPSDYTTFSAAVSALTSQGISASVVFEVKPGTYNEQISIGAITGASATKTITFRSQSLDTSSVTLSYASSGSAANNYVIYLNGADYVSFEYITIKRTGTANYAQVINVSNGATYNSFENCRIIGTSVASTTTFTVLVGSTNTLEDSYNTFNDNTFIGGSYGLYFLGRGSTMLDPGLQVIDNEFINQNYRGIYVTCMDSPVIVGNIVSSTSTNNNYYAIYGQYANNAVRILKNKIAASAGYGIYLTNSESTVGTAMLIANNFVAVGGSSTNYGFYLNQLKNANIYYNSVNMTGSSAGRAFHITGVTSVNNELLNNIFSNMGGGYAIYVDASTGTPILLCDNNDLYSNGANLGYWQASGNQANLSSWQTASSFDAYSISAPPNFFSVTDLHVTNGALNGKASINLSSLTPVGDDIDGDIRNSLFPDIGADEFNIEDVGVSSLNMNASYCQGETVTLMVYIRNYSAFTFQGNIPVFYQYNGGTVVNASTGSVGIPPNDSLLYMFMTQITLSDDGIIPIICGTNFSVDIDHGNDTLLNATLNVQTLPDADAGYDVYVCLGDSATLTATGGVTYSWNTMPPQTTATIHVLVNDTTEYIVEVTGANSCVAYDTVLVIPGVYPKPVADFSCLISDMQATFTDISSDAYGWDWLFGDGNTSTQQHPVHTYAANGNYNVRLIAYNGCDADTIIKPIIIMGIEESPLSASIAIMPNPASEYIVLQYPDELIVSEIQIQDLHGRKVLLIEDFRDSRIDLTGVQGGLYLVYIRTTQGVAVKKLVLKK